MDLSRLLYAEDQDGNVTKYIYGVGLIGQIVDDELSVYHYDYRGSTVAITDASGSITDTFEYDTYGKLIGRTGTSDISFKYNGRDGVITDENGLLYMRARYYSPDIRRFVNADILVGQVTDFATINRYAYANGNPVSNVDPFGLSVDRNKTASKENFWQLFKNGDGSYSLYDNRRHQPNNIFHEQILALAFDGGLELLKGELGLNASLSLITGGWEFDAIDLSLLDLGKAELGIGIVDDFIGINGQATIYAPSATVNMYGYEITFELDLGSVGASSSYENGSFKIGGSYGWGGTISISKSR